MTSSTPTRSRSPRSSPTPTTDRGRPVKRWPTEASTSSPPPQPIPTRGDMLTKADFDIDLETATITCPQGNTATIPPPNGDKRRQVRFAATDCAACELKPRCTTREGGRIIEINPHEELLAPARAQRHEPEFLSRYRLRTQAERKIAQIKSRTKKVPWRGLDKANLWLDLRIAALNLDRAGRLGIIR